MNSSLGSIVERRAKRRHSWPHLVLDTMDRRLIVRDWCRFGVGVVAGAGAVTQEDPIGRCQVRLAVADEAPTQWFDARVVRTDPAGAPLAFGFSDEMPTVARFFERLYLWRYQCEMAIHWIRFWSIKRHLYPKGISEEFQVPEASVANVFSEHWKPTPPVMDQILAHMRRTMAAPHRRLDPEFFLNDPAFSIRKMA